MVPTLYRYLNERYDDRNESVQRDGTHVTCDSLFWSRATGRVFLLPSITVACGNWGISMRMDPVLHQRLCRCGGSCDGDRNAWSICLLQRRCRSATSSLKVLDVKYKRLMNSSLTVFSGYLCDMVRSDRNAGLHSTEAILPLAYQVSRLCVVNLPHFHIPPITVNVRVRRAFCMTATTNTHHLTSMAACCLASMMGRAEEARLPWALPQSQYAAALAVEAKAVFSLVRAPWWSPS